MESVSRRPTGEPAILVIVRERPVRRAIAVPVMAWAAQ